MWALFTMDTGRKAAHSHALVWLLPSDLFKWDPYQECQNIPFTIKTRAFFFLYSNRLIKKPLCRALSCRSVLPWGIFFSACSPQDFDYFKPQSFPVILYLIFSLNFSPNCSSLDCPFLSPNTDDMFWTSTSLPLKTSFFCPDIFPKDKFPMPCIFMGKCSEMALPAGC